MKAIKFICGCISLMCWLAFVQGFAAFVYGSVTGVAALVFCGVAGAAGYRLGKFSGEEDEDAQ